MEPVEILIIDDGEDLLRFCEQFMPQTYHFIHARTAREGMRILEDHPVKLVMLDKSFDQVPKQELLCNDAGSEGLHILELLHQQYPQIPVVMITAHADASSQHKALALGAVDYVSWNALCSNVEWLKKKAKSILRERSSDSKTS